MDLLSSEAIDVDKAWAKVGLHTTVTLPFGGGGFSFAKYGNPSFKYL